MSAAFIFLLQCSAWTVGCVTVAASAQPCIKIGRKAGVGTIISWSRHS
ncbi:hypothetical protein AAE026_28205 [Bradyrhizobium sp. DN5]